MREATEVTGHCVRALYLAAGVTDLHTETGEDALLEVMRAQWQDMAGRKTYLTGGLGAHHSDEAFGDPYELPPDRCYGETCAAIASLMWNWRLLLLTGEARHADLFERTLYNGFIAGLALDGHGYSYVNPLHVRDEHRDPGELGARRRPWYACACCPPNVMRLLASLQHYLATRRSRRPPGPPVRDRADPRRGGRAGGHHRLSVGRPRRARGRRDRRGAVDAEPARAAVGGRAPGWPSTTSRSRRSPATRGSSAAGGAATASRSSCPWSRG